MSVFVLLLATPLAASPSACRPAQLRLSVDHADGIAGMSHDGVELVIRNIGAECMLPALPSIAFRDGRARLLSTERRTPPGMRPGRAIAPVRLGGGHRAATVMRWVSGPVYSHGRSIAAASVTVRIGTKLLHAPLDAVLYGQSGMPVRFEQSPLRAMEGMAAG